MKKAIKILLILSMALAIISSFALVSYAQAEEGAGADVGLALIGAAIAIGLSGLGSALSMGTASAAAIGAMAEKPEIFSKTLIYIVFIEAIAIYGLVVAFMILMKV